MNTFVDSQRNSVRAAPAVLHNLHLLRVIAALSVVYFHATSVAGLNLRYDVGSRGVDVFFVISGFIIPYIGISKPAHFLRRRLIRIVPFYWAATLCVYTMVIMVPQFFRSTTPSVPHLVTSLLFIPHESGTGEMHPTLELGWSLNFEMLFYVLFAIALAISRKWSALLCATCITAFVIVWPMIRSANALASFYARPIVLEFCFGIGVFYLFSWCRARRDRLATNAVLKWLLICLSLGGLFTIYFFEKRFADIPRYLAAGVPALAVVAGALLMEVIYGIAVKNRVIYLLGEASYVIYLIHPYIVFSVLRIVVKDAGTLSPMLITGLILALLSIVSVIAVVLHLFFEKPVMTFLRPRLGVRTGLEKTFTPKDVDTAITVLG